MKRLKAHKPLHIKASCIAIQGGHKNLENLETWKNLEKGTFCQKRLENLENGTFYSEKNDKNLENLENQYFYFFNI